MAPPTQTAAFSIGTPAAAPAAPSVPATGVAAQNLNLYPVTVVISANGATITNVSVNGVTVGTAAGTYQVPAGGAISIAYSVATPTWVWSNASAAGIACTATWNNGTATLTDTVTAGGAFLESFAGQAYANLNVPLPGWLYGSPS